MIAQSSVTWGQRGPKEQPLGNFSNDGAMPGICANGTPRLFLLGTELIKPWV